jgi:transcriptional regulator with XRE-family HTH domain
MGRMRREADIEAKLRGLLAGYADNPARFLRGDRPQMQVAYKSGMTQAHLSEVENRKREITVDVAQRLGPVLGLKPEELLAADVLAGLKSMANERPGELDAHLLMELIDYLDRVMVGADEFRDELLTTLIELAEARIEAYREQRKQGGSASLKARAIDNTRDPFGRRRRKPWGPGDLK